MQRAFDGVEVPRRGRHVQRRLSVLVEAAPPNGWQWKTYGKQATLASERKPSSALLGASGVWRPAYNKWRHSGDNLWQGPFPHAAVRSAVCQQELDHLCGAGLCCNMKQRGRVLGVRVQLEQVRSHCEELSDHRVVSRLAGRCHRRRNDILVAAPSGTPLRTTSRQRRWFHGLSAFLAVWLFSCRVVFLPHGDAIFAPGVT